MAESLKRAPIRSNSAVAARCLIAAKDVHGLVGFGPGSLRC